jgi:UDP-N-acetylglucosamine transferase subunit ALG13
MIFVATGTTGFDELVDRMDHLTPALGEAVVVQIGNGQYTPQHAYYFRFAPSLTPYYEQASLVVAHGGVGITLEVLDHGKPLVGVSNPDRYDQHQRDLLGVLAAQNYLVWCQELSDLAKAIQQAKQASFRRYVKPECTIHTQIKDFLDKVEDLGATERSTPP